MTWFDYSLIDASGRELRGRTRAVSAEEARLSLEAEGGGVVRSLRPLRSAATIGRGADSRLVDITRGLAAILRAGVQLPEALAFVTRDADEVTANLLEDVLAAVVRGGTLASAMTGHSDTFSAAYVGVVRAGERSGDLTVAFERLADQLEREARIRDRLVSAALYPIILACAGGFAVAVLVLFVLPRFAELLAGAGATLPMTTRLLLTTAAWSRLHWPIVAIALLMSTLSVAAAVRSEAGRRLYCAMLLRLPIVGELRRAILGWRFSHLLGTLLAGGTPLVSALSETATSLADPIAREEVERVQTRVREGASLSNSLTECRVFPALVIRFVVVGERSSQLPAFLLKAAEVIETRTDRALQRAIALLEPAMIIVFGGVIGFVALALLQAIYGFNANTLR